jgi:hypothetical protein
MRPTIVSVGPSLASSANDISTSQTPHGTAGQAAATFTASSASIAATNNFVAGQPVSFSNVGGTAATTANFGPQGSVGLPTGIIQGETYFVLAAGLSGSTFEVAATPAGTAIAPASIGTGTQYVVYGANVALNGSLVNSSGVAVLATPQRVLITTADTTHIFTVTGTNSTVAVISETVGPITTSAYTVQDFATVTSITINGTATAAVTVGTNGIGSTPWVRTDEWANPSVSIQCDASGTVNYTVQESNDDPNDPTNPVLPSAMVWISTNDPQGVGATTSILTNYLFAPRYVRILLNSGSGSVTATVTQYDVVSR